MYIGFGKYKSHVNKSKIAISWLVSYIIVFTIPILSNIYIYQKADNVIKDEVYQANSEMVDKLQLSVNDLLSYIDTLVMNISINNYVKELVLKNNENGYTYQTIKLAQDLKSYIQYNENISNIYIFFNKLDMAVSPTYYGEAKEFFERFYSGSEINYSNWYESVHTPNYMDYKVINHADGTQSVDFIYRLPRYTTDYIEASVVIRVDEIILQTIVKNFGNFETSNLRIIDNKGNTIMTYGNQSIPAPSMNYTDDSGVIEGKNSTIFYSVSSSNRWKFISITPKNILQSKLRVVRSLNLVNLFICTIIGGLLCFYFTMRNYKPINNLVKMCKKALSANQGKDEYTILSEILQDYISTKQDYMDIKQKHDIADKTQLIKKLLKGRIDDENFIKKDLSLYNIKFKSDYFAVIIFKIDNFDLLFAGDDHICSEEKFKQLQFIMGNVIEELIARKKHIGIMTEIDGQNVCIINLDESSISNWQSDIESIITYAKNFIEDNFDFSFVACISSVHQYLLKISAAFDEALQTLKYKTFLNNSDVVFYDTINDDSSGKPHYYPLDQERRLISFINLGDYHTSKSLFESIMQNHLKNASLDTTRILVFDLISTVLRSISEDKCFEKNIGSYSNMSKQISMVLNFETIEDFTEMFLNLLQIVCSIKKECIIKQNEISKSTSTETSHPEIVASIKEFIKKTYNKKSLNIAMIGDYFNITPYYASNLFKKVEGVSMLDYIGKLRIEKAKEMMNIGNHTLETISQHVGFTSVRTFMRTFVKYENITPGKYKEMIDYAKLNGKTI